MVRLRRTILVASCGKSTWANGGAQRLGQFDSRLQDQVFIDLRDRYGITQVVVEPENAEDSRRLMKPAPNGFGGAGKVRPRLPTA